MKLNNIPYFKNKIFLENNPVAKETIEKWCENQTKINEYPTGGDKWLLQIWEEGAAISVGWDRFPPTLIDLEKMYDKIISRQVSNKKGQIPNIFL